ncbi:MAG: VPLPA-CTERM sorting domain-containing protein [Paracoccaceae bacterium]
MRVPFQTAGAAVAAVLIAMAPIPAAAVGINGEFDITNLDAPLSGQSFSGTFSFDDAAGSGSGEEFIPLESFEFNFDGTSFTLGPPSNVTGPEAVFVDGVFLGISASGDTFSFVPGFFDVSEAFFSFDIEGGTGIGDTSFTLMESMGETGTPGSQIPLPAGALLMMTALAGIGLAARRRA